MEKTTENNEENNEENIEEIKYKKKLENITAENCLEFIYDRSDKWKNEKDPIESMKADLRSMICTIKENKFDEMNQLFLL